MTCTNLSKTLSEGSSDSEVVYLQGFLFDRGYLSTKPKGEFESETKKAIKLFQKDQGLSQSGLTDSKTRRKIKDASCLNDPSIAITSAGKINNLNDRKISSNDLITSIVNEKTFPKKLKSYSIWHFKI